VQHLRRERRDLRVLVFHDPEAPGARRDDALHSEGVQLLDVPARLGSEDILHPDPHGGAAAAYLLAAHDPEVHPTGREDPCRCEGHLLHVGQVGGGAAGIIEGLSLLFRKDFHLALDLAGPAVALRARHLPWVVVVLDALDHVELRLERTLSAGHHLVAQQVHELGEPHAHRAPDGARVARRAIVEDFGAQDFLAAAREHEPHYLARAELRVRSHRTGRGARPALQARAHLLAHRGAGHQLLEELAGQFCYGAFLVIQS
jgi:hypothetical protein